MKITIIATLVLFSSIVFGSHIERCNFEAKVVMTEKVFSLNQFSKYPSTLLVVDILSSKSIEGSYTDCQSFVGKELKMVEIDSNFSPEDLVNLRYDHSSGLTPEGVVVSESLIVVD